MRLRSSRKQKWCNGTVSCIPVATARQKPTLPSKFHVYSVLCTCTWLHTYRLSSHQITPAPSTPPHPPPRPTLSPSGVCAATTYLSSPSALRHSYPPCPLPANGVQISPFFSGLSPFPGRQPPPLPPSMVIRLRPCFNQYLPLATPHFPFGIFLVFCLFLFFPRPNLHLALPSNSPPRPCR